MKKLLPLYILLISVLLGCYHHKQKSSLELPTEAVTEKKTSDDGSITLPSTLAERYYLRESHLESKRLSNTITLPSSKSSADLPPTQEVQYCAGLKRRLDRKNVYPNFPNTIDRTSVDQIDYDNHNCGSLLKN